MDIKYLLILSTIITTVALLCVKKYITTSNITYIIFSGVLYLLLIYIYIELFQKGEISTLYVILQIIQVLIISLIGVVLYHDKLTYKKFVGILAGLICIIMLY